MDGLEAASKIVELFEVSMSMPIKPPPIIAVTANIMSNDLELYRRSGMSDCVGKPFTAQELWRCLIKFLPVESFSDIDNHRMSDEDEKNIKRLKANFVKENKNRFDEFLNALEFNDVKSAHRIAHSLKSNAGQIGKKRLQWAANSVEVSLTHGRESLEQLQISTLGEELKAVLDELAPLLDEVKDVTKPQITDTKQIHELFDKLGVFLENSDTECLGLIDDIRAVEGTGDLVTQIEDYDFRQASEILAKLRQEI
jgi:HPt (histidine-containing phosphotransfer) domain-containing protein